MAEHAQIDIRKGNKVVRIHSGWGVPTNILPALRGAATAGRKTPQAIATEFMRQVKDASFGLNIIAEDYPQGALAVHYTVDVSTIPWKVVQEKCAGHPIIDNGDGTFSVSPTLAPARKRTLFIKTMAATAGN